MSIDEQITKLEPWWERIFLKRDNKYTPGGRNKTVLLQHLDKETDILKNIKGKKILDIGCNAGGLMLELSLRGAIVTAIDVNDIYINQALFIKEYYNLDDCTVRKYNICSHSVDENLDNLGRFDIICYFGIIYHIHKENNEAILKYIQKATTICLSSSQITPDPRRKINWELSVDNINNLIMSTGFKSIDTLILDETKIGKLTNAYYFIIR